MIEPILGLPIHAVGIKQTERYLQWKGEMAVASLPSTAGKAMLNKQQASLAVMQKVPISTFVTLGKPQFPAAF